MYETRTKYIQDTYMDVYKTITLRFTPFPKPRDRAEKKIKIGSTFQPRLEGLLKMAANTGNTDKYRMNETTDAFHIQISRELISGTWQFPCVQPTQRC